MTDNSIPVAEVSSIIKEVAYRTLVGPTPISELEAEVAKLREELTDARRETMRMHGERMLGVRESALRQAAGVCASAEDREAIIALIRETRE